MSDPVLFVPGLMADARLFAAQTAALSARRAVQVASVTRGESLEALAERVLDDAPDRFALAGHGLGGMVAIEVLRQRPDRVLRLALISTSALPETPETAAAREPRIAAARAGRLADAVREGLSSSGLGPGDQRVSVQNAVLEMALALGPEVYVRQSRALQRRRDQQAMLRAARVPVLALCGGHDALHPVRSHALMRDLLPGAVMEVIADAGHYPTLERPQMATAALERWLTGTLLLT